MRMTDKPADSAILERLFEVIRSRRGGDVEQSYTAGLFADGIGAITQKFGEEAVETMVAALTHPPPESKLRPWLRQVVRNFARQHHRSSGRRRDHEGGARGPSGLPDHDRSAGDECRLDGGLRPGRRPIRARRGDSRRRGSRPVARSRRIASSCRRSGSVARNRMQTAYRREEPVR